MVKRKTVLLAALIFCLMCGCGKKTAAPVVSKDTPASVETKTSVTTGDQSLPETNTAKEDDRKLVIDRWADKGSFKVYLSEDEYFDFDFNYSIPQIVDDTEAAEMINYYIAATFEDMHETVQNAAKEGRITAEEFDRVAWYQTNYDCYLNGDIASIVIYCTGYYDSETQYLVYNYDFSKGDILVNDDLFSLKGTTAEKFAEDMRRAAVYVLDTEMQPFFKSEMPLAEGDLWYTDVVDDDVQHMYGDYLKTRAQTIYQDNINEYLQVYLDENGELQAVTHLYSMSMYGEATLILSPREWVNNGVKISSGNLLDVVSKNDGIYLTIYKDEWSEAVHDEFPTFEFSKEYKIDGLYKNYTDARVSWVGNGMQPYILLLSDDGMISYVDVWEGIASEYFCAVEPLWGLVNIKSFGDDSEYGVVAVDNAGKSIDVEEALYMMLNCRYAGFEKNLLNFGSVTRYFATVSHKEAGKVTEFEELIGFNDDQYHMFVRESYKTENYEGGSQMGYITFNGMNDKGMVFYFSLVGEEGELRGTMALNPYSFWDEEYAYFIDGADETWLGGFDIFESAGNRVILGSSVG